MPNIFPTAEETKSSSSSSSSSSFPLQKKVAELAARAQEIQNRSAPFSGGGISNSREAPPESERLVRPLAPPPPPPPSRSNSRPTSRLFVQV
ncbi:hypothetical protein NL676_038017 [Syzygium grande]|nr:hypothetical protein NL676_038017 [Syzygium grande]